MILEMVTNDCYNILYYVTTRLVLMDSIFSPLVYARIDRYSEAYTALTYGPCRLCGHTQTFPHGLTGKFNRKTIGFIRPTP